jgi:hypothetical protein
LCTLLLRPLLGKMSSNETSADGSNYCVVSGVMPGDAANYRTFDAACCIRHLNAAEREQREN